MGYEEIVLACDLVVTNGWRGLDRRTDARVAELSALLRRMSPERAAKDQAFRNIDGVGRKTHDLATLHRGYAGKPTRGGQPTADVARAFQDETDRMQRVAAAIRAAALDSDSSGGVAVDLDDHATFDEGRPFERRHLARERDPEARRRKILQARRDLGFVRCEACGFDFETIYGDRGRDYIESCRGHHQSDRSFRKLGNRFPGARNDLDSEILKGILQALDVAEPQDRKLASQLYWAAFRRGHEAATGRTGSLDTR